MPLSRNPRMDRRRRTIRENLSVVGETSDEGRVSPSRTGRHVDIPELTKKERGAAYSHSVRRACQHRLVQFIPIRKLSLTGAVAASAALPILLMSLHYLVFVTGTLDWSGHPMSALLNANSPRSLAAWLSSHLWLLCLASTVLTFRLRKHKLDDYDGEYRLWFWLVFTCVIGSIDSTTRLTELFGAALDRWSQLHVGWSGGAIVQATLATLIGMLGLRLCSELKSVPTSLILWLIGLVCWAASAALSQSLFKLDITPPVRSWLRASLWLGGLTSIWLCSLYFLRATFMEAQKRFLSRAITSASAVPWQQRLREAMPSMPSLPRFGFRRAAEELEQIEEPQKTKRQKKPRPVEQADTNDRDPDIQPRRSEAVATAATATADASQRMQVKPQSKTSEDEVAPTKSRWSFGLGKLALKPPGAKSSREASPTEDTSEEAVQVEREYGKKPGWFSRKPKEAGQSDSGEQNSTETLSKSKRSLRERFTWSKKRDGDQDAQAKPSRRQRDSQSSADNEDAVPKAKRNWLKLPKPKLPKISLPKPRLPKLKLPSFRLPPPGEVADTSSSSTGNSVPSTNQSRPLPSTSSSHSHQHHADDQETDNSRGLSKAERKRLKRLQQENERRAA